MVQQAPGPATAGSGIRGAFREYNARLKNRRTRCYELQRATDDHRVGV